jgi:NAD(P)-dependent dehydrogenase (short-subunit alcohol dehydrogenase family)
VLVNNAAFQMTYNGLEDISDEEWDKTFSTNIGAMFRIEKAAVPHMQPGSRCHASPLVISPRHCRFCKIVGCPDSVSHIFLSSLLRIALRFWRQCAGSVMSPGSRSD